MSFEKYGRVGLGDNADDENSNDDPFKALDTEPEPEDDNADST